MQRSRLYVQNLLVLTVEAVKTVIFCIKAEKSWLHNNIQWIFLLFFYIWTKTHTNMYYLRRANKLRIIEHNFIQHKHTFDIFGLFLIFWNFWHREKLSIILMNWIFGFYKIPAFDNNKKLKSFIHSTTLKKANQQYKKSNSTTLKREVFASPAGFLWINQAYPHLLWKMHSVQCILTLHRFLQCYI